MRRIVVVGGGITGLATAYYIQTKGAALAEPVTCTVIEGSPEFGGKIKTRRRDGFILEGGPDSFLAQKPWALDLCRELGLADRLIGTREAGARTSVLIGDQLMALPDGAVLGIPVRIVPFLRSPLISWPGKLRMALDLVIPPRRRRDDESLADFIRRRLGNEALEKIAEPLMAGIHVADPERLSIQATFPRLAELERTHGSLIRGLRGQSSGGHTTRGSASAPTPRSAQDAVGLAAGGAVARGRGVISPFLSFPNGMQELIDALLARLESVSLIAGRRARRIARRDAGPPFAPDGDVPLYRVVLDDGSTIEADAVVLATPAYVSAELVAELNPALAASLSRIHYLSTATVSLGYRRADVGHPLDGFGFVVPRRENRRISACTCSSTKFDGRAPSGYRLIRAFVGGARGEAIVDLDDDALINAVRMDVEDILGITGEPVITEVFRWRRGIPQYDVGHLERVAELDGRTTPGLFLAGAAYRGVGVPDCIHSGEEAAAKALHFAMSTQIDGRRDIVPADRRS